MLKRFEDLFLSQDIYFPPVTDATEEGIVAVGGDLSVERLLLAYQSGIFPWFSEGEPIIWWSPDPRFVLFPDKIKVSKSMKKIISRNVFSVTFDKAFSDVIKMCRKVRVGEKGEGTWITKEMIDAYTKLYELGFAHSVETWFEGDLVGGLYGISLGRCFFGESMFSIMDNASKAALIKLAEKVHEKDFLLIDCQVYTKHLNSMGAENITRADFINFLVDGLKYDTIAGSWEKL